MTESWLRSLWTDLGHSVLMPKGERAANAFPFFFDVLVK
jgi:hypothetical protein